MAFRKNLLVLITSVIVVAIVALLVKMPLLTVVDGLTLVIPTVIFAIALEDLWRKMLKAREALTWQYFVIDLLVGLDIVAFFWASQAVSFFSLLIRLGTTVGLAVLASVWARYAYKPSVQSVEEREAEKWVKYRKKVLRLSATDAKRILNHILRYRLIGDSLEGELDLDRPLAVYNDELMTHDEILAAAAYDSDADPLQLIAYDYIQALVKDLDE